MLGEGGWIIAHRGASGDCPENTLSAFQEAWLQGADAIEGDFRMTADGEIVCLHDADLRRTGGVGLEVVRATLEELRTVDVGAWKGERWRGERVPTLQEVLFTVPAGRGMVIEIKTGPEILLPLSEVLAVSPVPPGRIVLISFDREVVKLAKQRFPGATVWWLVELSLVGDRLEPDSGRVLETLEAAGADGVGVSAHASLSAGFVGEVLDAGYGFNVWTEDDPRRGRHWFDMGVQALTTNLPAAMRRGVMP